MFVGKRICECELDKGPYQFVECALCFTSVNYSWFESIGRDDLLGMLLPCLLIMFDKLE